MFCFHFVASKKDVLIQNDELPDVNYRKISFLIRNLAPFRVLLFFMFCFHFVSSRKSVLFQIDELPDVNYRTISFLIRHLARVAEKSQTNKMDVKNLAIIFGPSLIRPSNKDTDIM